MDRGYKKELRLIERSGARLRTGIEVNKREKWSEVKNRDRG